MFVHPILLGRGLIAFFVFASFGAVWSGIALALAGSPWHLSETQIGLFGFAGLAGALGAGRAGRWADAGHTNRVTGIALVILLASWVAIGQLTSSLVWLVLGVVLLDFAVQAVHVSNQHILTTVYAHRTSTAIGAYMVFYSLGSAIGAAATTALYDAAGWTGSALLGAAVSAGALVTFALSLRRARRTARLDRRREAALS
ncbi:MFS transporter [Sanguibacter sp. 25GB23B1]|uniref:MFS transporter n=1 Tax=unclassified Sanguibacter TaxID=2645534 RepID=UPI0032AF6023